MRICHPCYPLPLPLTPFIHRVLQALTKAFELLEASRALGEEASSECSTAILLLTDGTITEGLGREDPSEISAHVETLNADIEAQIFTFALGPEAGLVSASNTAARSRGGVTVVSLFETGGWPEVGSR